MVQRRLGVPTLKRRDDGHTFLDRLIAVWHSGANRFDKPGECLPGRILAKVSAANSSPRFAPDRLRTG